LKKPTPESFLCINFNNAHSSSTGFPQIRNSNFDDWPRHISNIGSTALKIPTIPGAAIDEPNSPV